MNELDAFHGSFTAESAHIAERMKREFGFDTVEWKPDPYCIYTMEGPPVTANRLNSKPARMLSANHATRFTPYSFLDIVGLQGDMTIDMDTADSLRYLKTSASYPLKYQTVKISASDSLGDKASEELREYSLWCERVLLDLSEASEGFRRQVKTLVMDSSFMTEHSFDTDIQAVAEALPCLRELHWYYPPWGELPEDVTMLRELEEFTADYGEATYVPEWIDGMPSLKRLSLRDNEITRCDASLLPALEVRQGVVTLNRNSLPALPASALPVADADRSGGIRHRYWVHITHDGEWDSMPARSLCLGSSEAARLSNTAHAGLTEYSVRVLDGDSMPASKAEQPIAFIGCS